MDTRVDINKPELHRLIRKIDARPKPARLRARDRQLIAERLRNAPSLGLRHRISVA